MKDYPVFLFPSPAHFSLLSPFLHTPSPVSSIPFSPQETESQLGNYLLLPPKQQWPFDS